MPDFDIFNGDADGICAIHQLRLAEPRPTSRVITGVKRDIALVEKVPLTAGARLRVCDISMRKNIKSVARHLEMGNEILYFDHHNPEPLPPSDRPRPGRLEAHIDTAPETCSSHLVDAYLGGRFSLWAMVGAYGDNQELCARKLNHSLPTPLEDAEARYLRQLGQLINYNAYGRDRDDLIFQPEDILEAISAHASPWDFLDQSEIPQTLCARRIDDRKRAEDTPAAHASKVGRVFRFPDAAWARRVIGDFANNLARREPEQAHAIAVENSDGSLRISIRAPLRRPFHADELARRFAGGGRPKAAGIDALDQRSWSHFLRSFEMVYGL